MQVLMFLGVFLLTHRPPKSNLVTLITGTVSPRSVLTLSFTHSVCFWTSAVKTPTCVRAKASLPAIGAQPQSLIKPPVILLFVFQRMIRANRGITSACHIYIEQNFFGAATQTQGRAVPVSDEMEKWQRQRSWFRFDSPTPALQLQFYKQALTRESALLSKHAVTEIAASSGGGSREEVGQRSPWDKPPSANVNKTYSSVSMFWNSVHRRPLFTVILTCRFESENTLMLFLVAVIEIHEIQNSSKFTRRCRV